MKKPLLFLLWLLPALAWGQRASEPFKKCNVIEVVLPVSDSLAFRQVGKYLIAQGFALDKVDREFLTLTTGAKQFRNKNGGRTNADYRYQIAVDRGKVLWRAESLSKLNISLLGEIPADNTWEPVDNSFLGTKPVFDEMQQTALAFYASFDGKEVYYSKR